MALRASVDASRLDSGILSVAGVAYGYDRAAKANGEWMRLMNGRTFHMTDLHAREGEFKGIDDDEVTRIMHGIVAIVQKYASYIVAVSCNVKSLSEKLPKITNENRAGDDLIERAFRSPYGMMLHLFLFAMGRFANRSASGKREISYILEAGDEGQKSFRRYIESLLDDPQYAFLLDKYSLSRLTATPKDGMEGVFHSADFFAWEWSRNVDRHKNNLPMRRSLSVAADHNQSASDYFGISLNDRSRHFFRHYDQRHANRWARVLREISEAQSPLEIDEAISQWTASRWAQPF